MTPVGTRRHQVLLQTPGAPAPDGDGQYTQTWTDLGTWHCAIEPATPRALERLAALTGVAEASHILKGRYLAGVTTLTRAIFKGRIFQVTSVTNLDERSIDMEVVAVEVVT